MWIFPIGHSFAGWNFVFLSDLLSPAELPPEMNAFKQQQHRWTKGSVQTARKLLPSILRARLPWRVKLEAFFHLTSTAVYIPAVILSLVLFPTFSKISDIRLDFAAGGFGPWVLIMTLCGLLTASAGTFYMVSQKEIGGSGLKTALMVPFLMALAMGICVINGMAVLEGLFGHDGEFVRTPKYGSSGCKGKEWKRRAGTFRKKINVLPFVEIGFGLYLFGCILVSIGTGWAPGTIPFLFIFMVGYLYVGILTLHTLILSMRTRRRERCRSAWPSQNPSPPRRFHSRPKSSGDSLVRPSWRSRAAFAAQWFHRCSR